MLADLGAEVIKIEQAGVGDLSRNMAAPYDSSGTSVIFHALNRGKKSVELDLRSEKGRELLEKIIRSSDVLVESFRPGVMKAMGFDPIDLRQKFPRLIICSITGFGQTGHRIGHDLNFLASSGILGLVDKPSPLPIPVADICGGSFPAAVQILAALHLRNKTGEGCYIDVAMADNTMAMAVMTHTVNSYAGAQVSKGNDFLDGSVPCYYVYPTADGYVAVGALEPKYWKQLLHLLDAPELVDYQYAKGKRGEYALTKLTQIFKSKTNQEWGKLLEKHDVLADIVTDIENLPQSHPHFAAKKLTSDLNIGEEKLFTVLRPPLNLSNGETATESTPRLGEQNAEILSKL